MTAVTRRGGTASGTIGVLAALAIVVGYFLPWTSLSELVEGATGLSDAVLADDPTGDERTGRAMSRLAEGDAISGSDWARVIDAVEDRGELDDEGQRVLRFTRVGIVVLPYAGAIVALLLFLMAIPAGRVARIGFAPIAMLVGLAQSRFFATLLLVVVMAGSLVVGLVSWSLFAGAELLGHREEAIGTGAHLMMVGSIVAFGSAFVGYGPGRLRAVLSACVLLIVLVVAFVIYRKAG